MSEHARSLGAAISFFAGLTTAFSPCLFPALPAYLTYLIRSSRSPLRVTLAFVTSMSAVLTAYALAVATLGALFALAAAPCAAGPLLAWTAELLLHPASSALNTASFVVGVAAPFLALGALAQSAGPKLHRAISGSPLVRRSHEITALALVLFAAVTLSTMDSPLAKIARRADTVQAAAQLFLHSVYLAAGLALLAAGLPRAILGALSVLLSAAGGLGVSAAILHLLDANLALALSAAQRPARELLVCANFAAWLAASAKSGGAVPKWAALSSAVGCALTALAYLRGALTDSPLAEWLQVAYLPLLSLAVGFGLSLLFYVVAVLKS